MFFILAFCTITSFPKQNIIFTDFKINYFLKIIRILDEEIKNAVRRYYSKKGELGK